MTRRQEDNREILRLLADAVENEPDSRFGQILVNLGIIDIEPAVWAGATPKVRDPFYEEPWATLERISEERQSITTPGTESPSGNLRLR